MKKLILVACVAAMAMVSCKKENTGSTTDICTIAEVHYGEDPNTDGLGWTLVTDSINWQYEVAENLDASFKTERLMVYIYYYKTANDFICFCPPPAKKIIQLSTIKVH